MRYVAAYLLAVEGGNASPSADDIKAILSSVGIEADADKLNKVCWSTVSLGFFGFIRAHSILARASIPRFTYVFPQVISELKGKNVADVIAEGSKKLASVPSGGAAVAAAAPGTQPLLRMTVFVF